MTKIRKCSSCAQQFEITAEDLEFYKKFNAEPLDHCFDCDQQQRLCFRNARSLYSRKCDATGETIISIFSPDKPYKVFKSEFWNSDQWDAMDYGRDFDFKRPFFEQFKELQLAVPRLALSNINAVNSPYCNSCFGNKNCHFIFGGDNNEDCMFGDLPMNNISSLDLDHSSHNELCYQLSDSANCYNCSFTFDSKNCNNSHFISECIGSTECIFSFNLANQSYCINNQKYSKEEYFEKKKEIINGSYQQQQKNYKEFLKMLQQRIVKYSHIIASQDCSGDYIYNSQNCTNAFDVGASKDLRNIIFASKSKDCFNSSMLGDNSELHYDAISTYGSYNVRHAFFVISCSDIEYCDFVQNSQNLFGCVGLNRKKYCIFNKQYSKEEYEKLRAKIIEHMRFTGEYEKFFPKNISCFGYNETTAQDYFPLTKEQALAKGFQWKDEDQKEPQPQTYKIPDEIKDVPDAITSEILVCESCHKNFKITAQELKFYHKMNIPVPRICSECRYKQRMSIRNPRKLHNRECDKCKAAIQTTYAPDRPEKVYCEKCYLEAVY